MQVIRAKRTIMVPVNPEQPDNNVMRPVQAGLVALIPTGFNLPKDAYDKVGKVTLSKKDEKEDE